jgi:hypothetical protein
MPKKRHFNLEPSSGSGNFLRPKAKRIQKNNRFRNRSNTKTPAQSSATSSRKTSHRNSIDYRKSSFHTVKVPNSYYGTKETEFRTRFIEMLFLEKSLNLLNPKGKIIFIFPNRIFSTENSILS